MYTLYFWIVFWVVMVLIGLQLSGLLPVLGRVVRDHRRRRVLQDERLALLNRLEQYLNDSAELSMRQRQRPILQSRASYAERALYQAGLLGWKTERRWLASIRREIPRYRHRIAEVEAEMAQLKTFRQHLRLLRSYSIFKHL